MKMRSAITHFPNGILVSDAYNIKGGEVVGSMSI